MRRMSGVILSISLVAVGTTTAAAETPLTTYGQQTCRQWLQIHQASTAQSAAVDGWALGYVQALSNFTDASRAMKGLPAADALKGIDGPTVIALVDRSCQGNPRRTLNEAVSALGAQLLASEPRVTQSAAR